MSLCTQGKKKKLNRVNNGQRVILKMAGEGFLTRKEAA